MYTLKEKKNSRGLGAQSSRTRVFPLKPSRSYMAAHAPFLMLFLIWLGSPISFTGAYAVNSLMGARATTLGGSALLLATRFAWVRDKREGGRSVIRT